MSKLGKIPITLPKGVECKVNAENVVTVKGSRGNVTLNLMKEFAIEQKDGQIAVIKKDEAASNAFYGLSRALLNNCITGVSQGFEKRLKLIGVGYRAAVKGNDLDLQIGLSHPTLIHIPEGIEVKVDKSTEIIISGIDKQKVGQFAAIVRAKKPPEPYKGKGIRYIDEYVRKKAGKAAKGAAGG